MRRVVITGMGDRQPARTRHALDMERRARLRERDRLHPVLRRQRVPRPRRGRGQRLRAAGDRLSEGGAPARPQCLARGRGGATGARGRRAGLGSSRAERRHRVRFRDRRLPRDHGAARGPAGARTDSGLAALPAQRPCRLGERPARDLTRAQGPQLRACLRLRDGLACVGEGAEITEAMPTRCSPRHRGVHASADPRLLRHARPRR